MAENGNGDKRPKPVQTPVQIKYVTEKLRSLLDEFSNCTELMEVLKLKAIQVKNWRNGTNGLEKVCDLAAELTRELGRIKDERFLSSGDIAAIEKSLETDRKESAKDQNKPLRKKKGAVG